MTGTGSDSGSGPPGGIEIVEICTTFGSADAAEACAQALVRDRLAACGQVDGPIRSTYWWQGKVETATEWRCTFKTTVARAAACRDAITAAHPYETPELLFIRALAAPAYAAWVAASVGEAA
ncbi:MAG: divalent-cation tolerance protein CutA [Planctomycetia bacterium]|jgi:periplasmic divalent cation tolerance protein